MLFDSCRDPRSRWGRQRTPMPDMHNSEWVQSPGGKRSKTPAHYVRLEAYVKGVVGAFANDKRILAWDIWNEPDNLNTGSYDNLEPANKVAWVLALLPRAFEVGSRGASSPERLTASEKAQLEMVGHDLVPQLRRAVRF
jgi:hypothetical protein